MTRDEVRLAITGPVAVGGGEITPRLVTRLLNDVGDHVDQLPVLQHALMRTWSYWEQHNPDGRPIDLEDYEGIGTMADALSRHAEEAYSELATERSREVAESTFKALTETTAELVGTRRPCSVGELCQIAGATQSEVVDVIDRFRAPGRSFLMPPADVPLDVRAIVDLSHESLMRLWSRLIGWTDEEVRSAEIYRRLSQAARLYGQREAGLWRDPELQFAVNWRQTRHPTAAWAKRYAPGFDQAIAFLAESERARDREVANKERQLVWTRRVAVALATLCLISIGTGIYAFIQRGQAVESAERALAASTAARQAEEAAVAAKGVADAERQNAETRKQEAEIAREDAIGQQRRAQSEADRATKEQKNAQQQALVALEQSRIADEQKRVAQTRQDEAQAAERRAEAALVDAQNQRTIAVDRNNQAEQARRKSDTLSRLTLARALAARVVGPWDAGQRQLAALLARQAFLLNRDNGGDIDDADIYSALRTSLALLAPGADKSFLGHEDAVRAIQLTPDGRQLVTGSDDGKVRVFPVGGSDPPTVLGAFSSPVRSLAIESSGAMVAAGAFDGSIRVWDLRHPKAPPILVPGHTAATSALAFDAGGRLVSASFDGRIRILEKGFSGQGISLTASNRVLSMALSADGNALAAGTDGGGLQVFDLGKPSTPPRSFEGDRRVSAVAFSRDGRLVVGGTQDGRILTWDISGQARQPIRTAAAHTAGVTGLSFGRTLLASSSLDGTVKLWRAQPRLDLDHPIVLADRGSWIWAVTLSPDDDRVFSATADRRVQSRMTRTTSLADQICSHVSANLTREQWNEYVSAELEYQPTCPGRSVGTSGR
jgi:WD40 repeat protein